MEQKTCTRCQTTKDLWNFGNRKSSPDGKQGWCSDCSREYHRAYRVLNPERVRAKERRYREKNRESYLAYQRYATRLRKKSQENVAPR